MWEEPCISGRSGSGTVFFSGCNMGCVFCQNYSVSQGNTGKIISPERLSEIFLNLQEQKACNINLVTPTHFLPHIKKALENAKSNGLSIPVVYNTSSYDKAETLKELDGLIDIYLPDLKYYSPALRSSLSPPARNRGRAQARTSQPYRPTSSVSARGSPWAAPKHSSSSEAFGNMCSILC